MDRIREKAETLQERVVGWRRHLHQHPELSFQEASTSTYLQEVLSTLPNTRIKAKMATHGIIAEIGSGFSPIVALRADMDALPIDEKNNLPYASTTPGVMHACGHDAHMAIALGVINLLADEYQENPWPGTVRFIFQPAEEGTDELGRTGAPFMIQEGALHGVSSVIALHMDPENPVGTVTLYDGHAMANVDNFRAVIEAAGGHGAYPHLATDPIWMLIPVLQVLHGIVSRKISPLEAAVLSVGTVQAGTAPNIIPTSVEIKGTLRSYSPEVREQLIYELGQAMRLVETLGGHYQLEILRGEPALFNHADVNLLFAEAIRAEYPTMKVLAQPFGLGGEDFGFMTQTVPGAMFFLGCGIGGVRHSLHSEYFMLDEEAFPIGITLLSHTLIQLMKVYETKEMSE